MIRPLRLMVAVAFVSVSTFGQVTSTPDMDTKIKELKTVLSEKGLRKSDPARLENAITQVAAQKIVDLIPELVQLLDYKHHRPETSGLIVEIHTSTPESEYPAIAALIRIGEPSRFELIECLRNNNPESLLAMNAFQAFSAIYRYSSAKGIDELIQAIKNEADPLRRARLQNAKVALESFGAGKNRSRDKK